MNRAGNTSSRQLGDVFTPTLRMVRTHARLYWAVVLLGLLGALAEGIGLGMLLPLLASMVEHTGPLKAIPLLGTLVVWLDDWPVGQRIQLIAVAFAGVGIAKGLLSYVTAVLVARFQVDTETDLRSKVYAQILDVEYQYVTGHSTGYLLNLLNVYPRVYGASCYQIAIGLVNTCLFVLYAVFLITLSWKLLVVSLLLLGTAAYFIRMPLSDRLKRAGEAKNLILVRLNELGIETYNALRLIRGLSKEARQLDRFSVLTREYRKRSMRQSRLSATVSPLFTGSVALIVAGFLIVSASTLSEAPAGQIPIILTFLYIMNRISTPMNAILQVYAVLMRNAHSVAEVYGFIDRTDKPYMADGELEFAGLRQDIQFNDVTFDYAGSAVSTIKGLSMRVPARKMTAIVGPSGAGKSTIVGLLLRLLEPSEGAVLVDGVDLRELRRGDWQSRIGFVAQDTFLFNDTILNNLRFATDASEAQAWEALQLADADGFVGDLPEGIHTVVGERAVRLSGGQQQRLAIARAILAKPDLLILDEATSSLDSGSEQNIKHAIRHLRDRCTLVVIAHRLSTIRDADQIVVVKDGRPAEVGTHAELMRDDGEYASLCRVQHGDQRIEDVYRELETAAGGAAGPVATGTDLDVMGAADARSGMTSRDR